MVLNPDHKMTILIPNYQGMDFISGLIMDPIPDHMKDPTLDNMMGPILDNMTGPILDNMTGPILDNIMGPILDRHMTNLILDNTMIPDHMMGPILDYHMTDLILDHTRTPDHMMGPTLDNMPNHIRVLIPDQNTEVVILGEITKTANSLLGGDKQMALISRLAVVVITGEETEGDITMCKMKIINVSTAINRQTDTTLTGIETQDQSGRCL